MNYTRGVITAISDLEQVRRGKKPDIFKRYLSVAVVDRLNPKKVGPANIAHLEIRNSGLKLIDHLSLKVGTEILFEYEFQGVTAGTRLINNILITQIKVYTEDEDKREFQGDRGRPIKFRR